MKGIMGFSIHCWQTWNNVCYQFLWCSGALKASFFGTLHWGCAWLRHVKVRIFVFLGHHPPWTILLASPSGLPGSSPPPTQAHCWPPGYSWPLLTVTLKAAASLAAFSLPLVPASCARQQPPWHGTNGRRQCNGFHLCGKDIHQFSHNILVHPGTWLQWCFFVVALLRDCSLSMKVIMGFSIHCWRTWNNVCYQFLWCCCTLKPNFYATLHWGCAWPRYVKVRIFVFLHTDVRDSCIVFR